MMSFAACMESSILPSGAAGKRRQISMASSDMGIRRSVISIPQTKRIASQKSGVLATRFPLVAAVVADEPDVMFAELMQQNSQSWFEAELQSNPPIDGIVSSGCVFTDKMNGWVFRGRDAIKDRMMDFNRAYPDFELSLLDVMLNVEAKSAACHWAGTATNLGPIGDAAPTGTRSRFSGVHLFTFGQDAKIIDVLAYREVASEEEKFVY